MEDLMVEHSELVEKWPKVFGPDGLVPQENFEDLASQAYDILVTPNGLRVALLFENSEVEDVFRAGADLVGLLGPTTTEITSVAITGGCIVYVDLSWEEEEEDDDNGDG